MTVECIGYRAHASGVLQGFANFRMTDMVPPCELFGCAVFMKNNQRWISMPSREYVDPETNEKKYISVFRFIEKEHNTVWSSAALKALDEWCAANQQQQQPAPIQQQVNVPPVYTPAAAQPTDDLPF